MITYTNKNQSGLTGEKKTLPSFMFHLRSNQPDLQYLSNIVHGLKESFPQFSVSDIVNFVNTWVGIRGKLTEDTLQSVKVSAKSSLKSSFIVSDPNKSLTVKNSQLHEKLLALLS